MGVGDTFLDCNGSSTFSSRVVIDPIKMVIWNKKPLVWF
jgi:hypothetical protein